MRNDYAKINFIFPFVKKRNSDRFRVIEYVFKSVQTKDCFLCVKNVVCVKYDLCILRSLVCV